MATLGRPTAYKPEYCQQLVEHMSEGFSYESFAGKIDVCRDTLYEWEKVHKSFSDAKKKGRAKSQLWWEEKGRDGMNGKIKGFVSAVWIFSVKNHFGWADKVEVSGGEGDKPIILRYKA